MDWLATIVPSAEPFALMLLTFVLAALIGLEREWHSHACGLRPSVLVAIGAAAFGDMIVNVVPSSNWGNAFGAIVTGVGFLGAGAIIKQDNRKVVHGISTAATIWVTAIFGLLIGVGRVRTGVGLALIVLATNVLLRPAAEFIARRSKTRRSADDVMDG